MFETFIVNPLITVLALLYSLLGNNIVLAIVVLTVVIRLATSPLLIRQQQATAKMQELQPEIAKLREKHKNDREKLAQEQMELFRKHGVNPLGGCLPLFIQLPILIALYQAIIHGLSATPYQVVDLADRFLIPSLGNLVPMQNVFAGMDLTLPPTVNPTHALLLPMLVFVTTWLQSKLTIPTPKPPADGKEDQAAQMTRTMTTIMPIMFALFALSFSVGISIYFVVSNLVGIVQYTLMGKAQWGRLFGREEEDAAPEKGTPAVVKSSATATAAAGAGETGAAAGAIAAVPSKAEKRKAKKMRSRENRK